MVQAQIKYPACRDHGTHSNKVRKDHYVEQGMLKKIRIKLSTVLAIQHLAF